LKKTKNHLIIVGLNTGLEAGLGKLLPLIQNVAPVYRDEGFAAVVNQAFNPFAKPLQLPRLSLEGLYLEKTHGVFQAKMRHNLPPFSSVYIGAI